MAKKKSGGQKRKPAQAKKQVAKRPPSKRSQPQSTMGKAKAMAKAKTKSPAGDAAKGSFFERTAQFMREVKTELKKVTWPSKRQTIQSTGVVLVLVTIVSVFLGLVDMVLSRLVRLVIG